MLKAVIFDMDGTLLDSVDQHAEAWQKAFAKFGFEFPLPDIRYQIGKGGDKLLETFLSPEQIQEIGQDLEKYRSDLFKTQFRDGLRGFPKVRELLEALRAAGLKTGLATSGKKEEVDFYLGVLHIRGLLDAITTKDDVENSKPEPDVLTVVRERLGNLKPADCVFIGDTAHDAEAARKDGMPFVGLRCGGFPEDDLRKAGARELFKDPEDLLKRWAPMLQTS